MTLQEALKKTVKKIKATNPEELKRRLLESENSDFARGVNQLYVIAKYNSDMESMNAYSITLGLQEGITLNEHLTESVLSKEFNALDLLSLETDNTHYSVESISSFLNESIGTKKENYLLAA